MKENLTKPFSWSYVTVYIRFPSPAPRHFASEYTLSSLRLVLGRLLVASRGSIHRRSRWCGRGSAETLEDAFGEAAAALEYSAIIVPR